MYWYHPDHLGSSSFTTGIDGEVNQNIEYFPSGEVFLENHLNSYNTPYKFNSKELDDETGYYYYGARYYNPRTSLWLNVDPAFEEYPSWSPYNYALQNPIRYTDPDGRSPWDNFIFDQFGRYVRTEKTNAPHQLIIENSINKYQRVYQFNDPKTDASAINYNIKKFGKEEFKKMQFVFFMSENWLDYAASDSNVGNQSWLENTLKPLRSVGEEMDPAAYNLPQFFDEQNVNLLDYWNDNEIFKGDKGPLFIIEGDGYQAYNYMDTGNFIWGHFMNILGYSSSEAIKGAKRFNSKDTKADLTAVRNGSTHRDTKNKIFPKPIINLLEYQKKKANEQK